MKSSSIQILRSYFVVSQLTYLLLFDFFFWFRSTFSKSFYLNSFEQVLFCKGEKRKFISSDVLPNSRYYMETLRALKAFVQITIFSKKQQKSFAYLSFCAYSIPTYRFGHEYYEIFKIFAACYYSNKRKYFLSSGPFFPLVKSVVKRTVFYPTFALMTSQTHSMVPYSSVRGMAHLLKFHIVLFLHILGCTRREEGYSRV